MHSKFDDNMMLLERMSLASLFIGTTFTALRIWTRARLLRVTGAEEWIMLLAWLCFVSCNGSVYVVCQKIDDIFFHGISTWNLEILVRSIAVLYVASVTLVKVSAAYFFLHIYSVHATQRRIIYGLAGFLAVFSGVTAVVLATSCHLMSVVTHDGQFCRAFHALGVVVTTWCVLNSVSDLMYMTLAVHAMRNARIAFAHKAWCVFLLLLTLSGGAVSFARIGIVSSRAADTFGCWVFTMAQLTLIEMLIVITAANMICLKPLLSMIHNLKWFGPNAEEERKSSLQKRRETVWGPISPKRPLYDTLSSFRSEVVGGFTGLGGTAWAKAECQPNCLLQINLPINESQLSLTTTESNLSFTTSESKVSLAMPEVEQIQRPAPVVRTLSKSRRGPRSFSAGQTSLLNFRISTFEPLWEGLEFEEHDPSALERGEKQSHQKF